MSTSTEQPPRRRLWPAVLVGAVLIGGGLGIYTATRPADATPTTAPTAAATAAPSASAIQPVLSVEAGGGGTTVATIDGVTPMGYPDTCEGAVAAAANQLVTIAAMPEGWTTPEGLARYGELVDYFSPGEIDGLTWSSTTKSERAEAAATVVDRDAVYTATELDASLGAFNVLSCTEATTVVDIVYGAVLKSDGTSVPAYGSQRVEVGWLGDWSIREVTDVPIEEDPASKVQPEGEFTAASRAELIAAGGSGWTEFSNARP